MSLRKELHKHLPLMLLSLGLLGSTMLTSCVKPPERPQYAGKKSSNQKPAISDPIPNTPEVEEPSVYEPTEQKPIAEIVTPEVDPVQPSIPTKPTDPIKPVDPVKPIDPVKPVEPVKPIEPQKPAGLASLMTEAQFNSMFPQRIAFYSYQGLVEAADAIGGFAKEGSIETRKRELAALLANGEHESDHFKATREYNTANYDHYCDKTNSIYPCKAGQQYYGRGPIQLSWNYNYGAAGEYLKLDLLNNPDLVATSSKVAWQTMMWFWMTSKKAGVSPHDAMVKEIGFGMTIDVINGALECRGGNAAQVQSRIKNFNDILGKLGVSAGPGRQDC
jgi:predicted chitinase